MKHLSLAKPHLIVTVGTPGSGKSFFAEKFAETFGAPYINQKKIAQLAKSGDIDKLVELQLDELLKTKQSIIFDGDSATRAGRANLSKKARDAGYVMLLIWTQTDQATAKSRHKVSDPAAHDIYEKELKRFTPPNATEKPLVISGKHTYASQAKVVLKRLSAPRAEIAGHDKPPMRPRRPGTIVIR